MHKSLFELREGPVSLTPDPRDVWRPETQVGRYALGARPRSAELVERKVRERVAGDAGGTVVAVDGG